MGLRPARRFQTAKAGNRPDECEDADLTMYPYAGGSYGGGPARIALSDGASESAFARQWAQILSRDFVRRPLDLSSLDGPALAGWLEPCEREWSRAVPWERIPWHGEAKTRAGAVATLLGLTVDLTPGPYGTFPWQAVAVGDCCLFVVRDDALAVSFPLEDSGQFNNTPSLVCSNPANNGGLWSRVHQLQGEFRPGDLILLASDALACWILQERESGGRPWEALLSLDSESQWSGWVETQRSQRTMRNDDTTLIAVAVE